LRELEDGVVVVDLVGDVLIAAGVLPVPLDLRPPLGIVHPRSLSDGPPTFAAVAALGLGAR
jgi:hypothetical protein